jgi:hypothetical protein
MPAMSTEGYCATRVRENLGGGEMRYLHHKRVVEAMTTTKNV